MKAGELEIIPVLGLEPSLRAMVARRMAADRDAELVTVHLGEGRPSDDVLREVVDGLLEAGARRAILDMGEEVLTTEVIGSFTQLPQADVAAVVAAVDPDRAIRDLTGEDYVLRLHDDGVGSFHVPRSVLLTSQLEYATTIIFHGSDVARRGRPSRTDVVSFAMALGPSAQILGWNERDALPTLKPAHDLFRTTPGWLRVLNGCSSEAVDEWECGGTALPGSLRAGGMPGLGGLDQRGGAIPIRPGESGRWNGSIWPGESGQRSGSMRLDRPTWADRPASVGGPAWAGRRARADGALSIEGRTCIFHYRRERPFHPGRLLQCLEAGADWAPLLRVAGFTRIASRPGVLSLWEQTGVTISVDPYEADWWTAQRSSMQCGFDASHEWPAGSEGGEWNGVAAADSGRASEWHLDIGPLPDIGDAVLGQDIVAIGVDLEWERMERELDSCLLTDAEFLDGVWAWVTYEDAFPERSGSIGKYSMFRW